MIAGDYVSVSPTCHPCLFKHERPQVSCSLSIMSWRRNLQRMSLVNAVSFPGRRHGVTDLGAEVVNYVSHATQQHLQKLLEKVSQVAQQKTFSFKVCLPLYHGRTCTVSYLELHLAWARFLGTDNRGRPITLKSFSTWQLNWQPIYFLYLQ